MVAVTGGGGHAMRQSQRRWKLGSWGGHEIGTCEERASQK